ncbi:AsmA-like C-terminal region-containing protein [Pelagicoccus albus]|uniref:AsmA-like C-terminal domain-containing protein n=1 Tax=Pelagicoccus albus TaxID=415222 RepID=A0A7X1B956_9BACT|nr:AsmA-like C-terminal region-containing protein [Pelagicoccus albus]MBC2606660.1 hypothetical protein [Pelagicoccus albus]
MSKSRKSPTRFLWKSTCHTCQAVFQWCYSAFVLLLIAATAFAAYVATLDAIPVPEFLIREIRGQLQKEGIRLNMEAISFQPNGRIVVEQPEFYSQELGSTIVSAERLVARLKLRHLLFGGIALDEIKLSSGKFIIPAMLTPTGEPSTAISSINLDATLRADRWSVHYANLALGDLKLSIAGRLDSELIRVPAPKPDAPKFSLANLVLKVAPQVAKIQKELDRFESPFCIVDLYIDKKQQAARIYAGSSLARVNPQVSVKDLVLHGDYSQRNGISVVLEARKLQLPSQISARTARVSGEWDLPLQIANPFPRGIRSALAGISYQGVTLPSVVVEGALDQASYQAEISLALPDSPVVARFTRNKDSGQTDFDIRGQLDSATIDFLAPLAQTLAKLNLPAMATVEGGIDFHAQGGVDAQFKPTGISAFAQAGPTSILGADIDFAQTEASLVGPQIDVSSIKIRSGKQGGEIRIGYNLETLFRRIMVEGSLDPTMINGWFKPWWSAMWDGMTFPEEGMMTYLDSQATFKKPDTVFVTGTGYTKGMDLRGMKLDELRTRIFSRFHYVDLYDMELSTAAGEQAQGEIQFHMDRDIRDDKDKLTGIWIEAVSTLDVKKAPDILWEISEDAADILEPYCYDLPPLIEARSASIRRQDEYINDIDLDLQTQTGFTFYGFPFESLDAFVHIDDDIIDIPFAEADLGGGKVNVTAFIIGDVLDLDARMDQVGFGEALNASNTYFANDGSETAQAMDPERLLSFGGKLDANFLGAGIVGDSLSFEGDGKFDIKEADFGSFRLFGLLSMALEITPLRFTTLKFTKASSPYTVDKDQVIFTDSKLEGGGAAIETEGIYNIETDALNFSAKLFPFRNSKVPILTPLINLPLNVFSNVFEVSVTGTFDEPELRLFNPSTKEEIDVSTPADTRNSRPAPARR